MAIVVTFDTRAAGQFFSGSEKVRRGTIALGTYAANGVAVTPSTFALKKIGSLRLQGTGGLIPEWDATNAKIKVYYPTGGATTAPTTATAVPIVTSGASTASAVSGTTPAITPGVGKEVGDTADLSSIAFRFEARGL